MNIYKDINEITEIKFPVVTTGGFDGVHTGHKVILESLVKTAHQYNGESIVITFSPHPRIVLYNDSDFKLLTTDEEKINILEKLNVDHLIIYPFTKEFSETTSDSFIKNILIDKLHTKKLVIGYNHHFGNKRSGNFSKLLDYSKAFDFDIEEIAQQELAIDQLPASISSTNIRKALFEGSIPLANSMLGYKYNITGKVIEGSKLGKQMGFPTANIEINNKYKLIPSFGVYAVQAQFTDNTSSKGEGRALYKGMLYIGTRPTISELRTPSIEINIFDFDKDIYNENLTVYFIEKIRDDIKFNNLAALKQQIINDKKRILNSAH